MGIAEYAVVGFGQSAWRDAIAFVILILILLSSRPASSAAPSRRRSDGPMPRRATALPRSLGSLHRLPGLASSPRSAALSRRSPGSSSGRLSGYTLRILLIVGIAIIMAVSLNLINGIAGQFSLGHAGLHGGRRLQRRRRSPWSLGPRLAARLPALAPDSPGGGMLLLGLAMLVGGRRGSARGAGRRAPEPAAARRLPGDRHAGLRRDHPRRPAQHPAVGGAQGLTGIPALTNFFWVALAAVAVIALSRNLVQSTHGLAFLAVREDEVAAEAMGVNTTRMKVLAFVIGAFFAGVGGALFAHLQQFIQPKDFNFMLSVQFVVMVVLGGTGSITGVSVAAAVSTLLPEVLRCAERSTGC